MGKRQAQTLRIYRFPVYGEAVPKGLKGCLLSFTQTYLGDSQTSPKRIETKIYFQSARCFTPLVHLEGQAIALGEVAGPDWGEPLA